MLNGNSRELADAIRPSLVGYSGRLGLHAPFRSLPIKAEDPDVHSTVDKRLHQALDVCDHLGATQMVVHSPYTAAGCWDDAVVQPLTAAARPGR